MNDDELELGHYGRIFRRSWWIFALAVVSSVLLAVLFLPNQRNFYESNVSVRLVPSDGDVGTFNDPIIEETEAIIATKLGDEVLAIARERNIYPELTLEGWSDSLLVSACADTGALVISNNCNTQILDFSYRASSAEKSETLVQLTTEVYLDARFERAQVIRDNSVTRLNSQLDDLDLRIQTEESILRNNEPDSVEYTLAEIRLRRIEPERLDLRSQLNALESTPLDVGSTLGRASTPEADASGIPRTFAILAGILMGLLLGGLAAILSDRMDRRVSSVEETEIDLGVPVLGDIPRITEGSPALVTAVSTETAGAESFRRLAAAALAPRHGFVVDSIAVTGANEGEGRTTAAVNLAIAISQTGRNVLFVAADRRNEAADQLFGLSLDPGLNDFLRTKADLDSARKALDAAPQRLGITILPSGLGAPTPLSNNGVAALLAIAQERNMIVVFDTPPALTHADGLQIAAVADAVYIVAAVGRTRRSELNELRVQLLNVQADVVGAIINRNSRLSLLPAGYGDVGAVHVPTGVPGNRNSRSAMSSSFGATAAATPAPQATPSARSGAARVADADVVAEVHDDIPSMASVTVDVDAESIDDPFEENA